MPTHRPLTSSTRCWRPQCSAARVLEEVEDHRGRLPVDPDRDRDARQNVGLEVRHRDRDLVRRQLDAANARPLRVRAPASRAGGRAVGRARRHVPRHDQTVIEKGRRDGGAPSLGSARSARKSRPERSGRAGRIASMTWKRLIARISSGSAVFIEASRIIRNADFMLRRMIQCQRR